MLNTVSNSTSLDWDQNEILQGSDESNNEAKDKENERNDSRDVGVIVHLKTRKKMKGGAFRCQYKYLWRCCTSFRHVHKKENNPQGQKDSAAVINTWPLRLRSKKADTHREQGYN